MVAQVVINHYMGDANVPYWGGNLMDSPPASHEASMLANFVQEHLARPDDESPYGAELSQYGLFGERPHNEIPPPYSAADPFEVWGRNYEGGTYYPRKNDKKGWLCYWDGTSCDWYVGDKQGGGPGVNFWQRWGDVPYGHGSSMTGEGAGGMLLEAPLFLRFIRKFMLSASKSGRTRTTWDYSDTKNGVWHGAIARANTYGLKIKDVGCTHRNELKGQVPGGIFCADLPGVGSEYDCEGRAHPVWCETPGQLDCCDRNDPHDADCFLCVQQISYAVPEIDPLNGSFYENPPKKTCRLPYGLYFVFAMNQNSDAQSKDGDYGLLDDFILDGLCQVDFPPNPFALWPEVLAARIDFGDAGG
jgi:hypothetical protein